MNRSLYVIQVANRSSKHARSLLVQKQCGSIRWVGSGSSTVKKPETLTVIDPTTAIDTATKDDTKKSSVVKDVMELSKFRLSALVVSTASAGFLAAGVAGGGAWSTLACCCVGTAMCSSSASTWNQILEVDRDAEMKRTRQRPLVRQSITLDQAKMLGGFTGLTGGAILAVGTDPITTALGVGNIALYSGLYTYMKPRSELNTWVGAVVGAIPPVMGWTAAGGSLLDTQALLLGGMLYLWQMPHFFALSWMHRVDYARGGFQMVPVNDPTGDRTSSLITRYTWYLSTIPVLSYALDATSSMFLLEGVLLNGYALHVAHKFHDNRSNANARKVFLTSLWYLPCLMTLFILHSKTWGDNEAKMQDEDRIFLFYKDMVQAVRQKGRDLCIHEVVTQQLTDEADGDEHVAQEKCPFTHAGQEKATQTVKEVATEATQKIAVVTTK